MDGKEEEDDEEEDGDDNAGKKEVEGLVVLDEDFNGEGEGLLVLTALVVNNFLKKA